MDSPKIVYKYYSNPAFCGQSEVVFSQTAPCVSTKVCTPERQRLSPLGANSPRKSERSHRITRTDISDNPLRIASDEPPRLPPKPAKFQNFHRQSSMIVKPTVRAARVRTRSEDLEMAQMRHQRQAYEVDELDPQFHRYEVIDDTDFSPTKKRIVQIEVDEYNVDGPDENELKEIPTEIVKTVNGKTHRYAIVPTEERPRKITFTSPVMSKKHLIATQKLHELLSTPSKLKSYGSQPSVDMTPNKDRFVTTPKRYTSTPNRGVTPSKSCANLSVSRHGSPISPKAQQKLQYEVDDDVFVRSYRDSHDRSVELDRRERSYEKVKDKKRDRTTAVIVPRVASPPAYSEEHRPWSSAKAGAASLALAALMLTLCGALAAGLSFFMMYSIGRVYYLDFGVLSGFTCLLLGLLGFRSRRNQLLPNRNYISGYIVLSTFSVLSAAGLLVLLTAQPRPGSALSDVTSGAVCGLSLLSLALASLGVVSSYCCQQPPPDNRVASTRWY